MADLGIPATMCEAFQATGIFSAGHPLRRKLISAFAQLRG